MHKIYGLVANTLCLKESIVLKQGNSELGLLTNVNLKQFDGNDTDIKV